MASREHIFLSADGEPEEVASWLASLLGMSVTHDDNGNVLLFRPAYAHPGEISIWVRKNVIANPAPEPDEVSLTDDFTTMLDVHYTGRDSEIQEDEAKRLFGDLSAKASVPMALLGGLEILLGAYTPERGLTWFPPGTTPEFEDRTLWMPYRVTAR